MLIQQTQAMKPSQSAHAVQIIRKHRHHLHKIHRLQQKNRNKQVNFENIEVATPKKRTRRCMSMCSERTNAERSPAKRQRGKIEEKDKEETSLSALINMNCKLTNEVLSTKKQLCEKVDALLNLQITLREKIDECNDLRAKVNELENRLEKMQAEQYCDDLIQFEPNTNDEQRASIANRIDVDKGINEYQKQRRYSIFLI